MAWGLQSLQYLVYNAVGSPDTALQCGRGVRLQPWHAWLTS